MPISSDHPSILFDGSCGLCHRSIRFIIAHDPDRIFRFASFESEVGLHFLKCFGVDASRTDSVVLIDAEGHWLRSDAALRIAGQLSGAWSMLALLRFVPRPIRDRIYRIVAKNRHRFFARRNVCDLPTDK